FIWENYYDPDSRMNEYDLTVFVREADERYRKFEETHLQRGYTLEEIRSLLERAGLVFVEALDSESLGEVSAQSERIYVIARECGKNCAGESI
ncbi:MAG: class I SAM-dependent methyltransferase, partial [Lachnospiraceae bacterium]|nr:class I SAM-dependent methyltransferase [Lachnospiraceae bacterium]